MKVLIKEFLEHNESVGILFERLKSIYRKFQNYTVWEEFEQTNRAKNSIETETLTFAVVNLEIGNEFYSQ